jgi:hypothetical protein
MTVQPKINRRAPKNNALYSVLSIERLQGRGSVPIAVLLLDIVDDKLYMKFRDDLADVADTEELGVLEGMADTIMTRARDEGATRLFDWFRDTLSGYVRMDEPRAVPIATNWKEAIDRLFTENVKAA